MKDRTHPQKGIGIVSMLFPPDPEVGALRVGKLTHWLCHDHAWRAHVVKRARSIAAGKREMEAEGQTVHAVKSYDSQAPVRWIRSFRRSASGSATGPSTPVKGALGQPNDRRRRGIMAQVSDLLVVPDSEQTWIWGAYRQLRRLVREKKISVLYSSGPPHTAHLAAYWCKRRNGLPWVLDLRDPWCANPYELQLSPIAQSWNHSLERRCFARADRILTNTEPARQVLLDRYPDIKPENVITLTNGIDEEDYQDLKPNRAWETTERPVFVHAGSLYLKRDPTALIRAFTKFKSTNPASLPILVFMGNWDEGLHRSVIEIIASDGLQDDIQMLPPQPRRRTLEALMAADALLLIGDSEASQVQVPAKVFESLHLAKPILSLFKLESPVNQVLDKYCPRFEQAHPSVEEQITAALSRLCGKIPEEAGSDARYVRSLSELSRRSQAAQLSSILESMLSGNEV